MAKKGRKTLEIDWDKVDKMLRAQCSGASIASAIGVHFDTLKNRVRSVHKMEWADYAAAKKADGRENLRYKQYEYAMMGDKTLLIWLGKQLLGQRDKDPEDESSNKTQVIIQTAKTPSPDDL